MPSLVRYRAGRAEEDTSIAIAERVHTGLRELVDAYPNMLSRLHEVILAELQIPNGSPAMLEELRERAANIRELGGDHRLEAFIMRLTTYEGGKQDIEGLAGMAANKPVRDWVDPDVDRAIVDLAEMAQQFLRAETFARVKGRPEKRHAMAVIVGLGTGSRPLIQEFQIADGEREAVKALINRLSRTLYGEETESTNIVLAALAELSVQHMGNPQVRKPVGNAKEGE